jgi:hypothetical protein
MRRKEIAAQITVTKATGTSIVNTIALGIWVLVCSVDLMPLCRRQYRPKLAVFKPH